jgi:hypothetical protein
MISIKRLLAAALFACVGLSARLPASDYYKLENVTRLDHDLYRSRTLLIMTKYCYHFCYGEAAILKYVGTGDNSGSKLIWDDGSNCEVKKLLGG